MDPFPLNKGLTLLCNNCLGRTKGDKHGLMLTFNAVGGDDTPAPPASDLWSSDVRFTLTKSVCKTSEFGDSTAGCHGDEVSWEMQVGKQARPDDYVA